MHSPYTLTTQAILFTKYLIGKMPDKQSIALYSQAIKQDELTVSDKKVLSFMLRWPRLIGFIDAGLALTSPHSEVRRRIYVMFAILESQPLFWRDFLPVKRSGWYVFFILLVGLRSIVRAVGGILIVKVLGASSK